MKNILGLLCIAIGSHIMLIGMKTVDKSRRIEIIKKFQEVFHV
jgi:hypothetical protein